MLLMFEYGIRIIIFKRSAGAQWQSGRLEIEGSQVRDLPEALRCVLEQNTLSCALYWFNPGKKQIVPHY